MKRNAMRAMVILCVLSSPMGCQLIKRLTNRGQDAGATTAAPPTPITPAIVDADAGQIAVPNPTVAPMPTADTDAAVAAMPAADAAVAAMPTPPEPAPAAPADAGAPTAPQPTVAEPTEPDGPRRPRGPRNYCKDHPGRVNPATGEVCPMRGY